LATQNDKGRGTKDFKAESFCGTPLYLAPEMIEKKGVSKSSDVY